MAGVKQENSELQDRNLALINRLRSKEEELERMLREQARPAWRPQSPTACTLLLLCRDMAASAVTDVCWSR